MINQMSISRHERNKARTRKAIISMAQECFGALGVDGVTMNEVADRAEVSRATLFKYFSSKSDLVEAVASQMDDDFFRGIWHFSNQSSCPSERLRLVFENFGLEMEKASDSHKNFVGFLVRGWNYSSQFPRMERFRAQFREMLDCGSLSGSGSLDFVTDVTVSIFLGLLHNWRAYKNYPLRERLLAAADEIEAMIARHRDVTG